MDRDARQAWRSPQAWMLLAMVACAALALDLWTKHLAFARVAGTSVVIDRDAVLAVSRVDPRAISRLIPDHPPVHVVPSVLDLTLVLNPGAVFGMGAGRRVFFMVFTGATVAFAVYMFAFWLRARERWAHGAVGLLIAGGLGNFYDRWTFACVRDFLHPLPGVKFPGGWAPFGAGGEVWPWVSNVADAWLLVGIAVLAVSFWRQGRSAAAVSPQGESRVAASVPPPPAVPGG